MYIPGHATDKADFELPNCYFMSIKRKRLFDWLGQIIPIINYHPLFVSKKKQNKAGSFIIYNKIIFKYIWHRNALLCVFHILRTINELDDIKIRISFKLISFFDPSAL